MLYTPDQNADSDGEQNGWQTIVWEVDRINIKELGICDPRPEEIEKVRGDTVGK